ncbi:hypothetical protein B0T16DRAFT_398932 [Cercophora newfieldiana]|uniref:Alkyl hydroperoxide reductase subunit C/ Thiol specific antioxidant domain-containing protein n=1 Tax=Cercophora newfieldiana TaxID=92897 RepID=A0AA40D0P5_9PEZI|nr:hypothetical protein B0T16DRAFT_398932 [Cercophora newfieldiana]
MNFVRIASWFLGSSNPHNIQCCLAGRRLEIPPLYTTSRLHDCWSTSETMFSNLATKVALKKVGLSTKSFNLPWSDSESSSKKPASGLDSDVPAWPAWMTVKSLPLTVQPWLTPVPPPIPIAAAPKIGDMAPMDRDRELTFGGGKKVIVIFLRCVGCAFAQKLFLQLRGIATRYPGEITCVAVSHSSAAATQKWLDLLGGSWNVNIVIDEDRAVYAAWGLGLGSVWYVLNPTSTVAGFKEKGWLGSSVAGSLQRSGALKPGAAATTPRARNISTGNGAGIVGSDLASEEGPVTVMGNKWQESGAWAVDGRGKIAWGGKAARADDVMDLEEGVKSLFPSK